MNSRPARPAPRPEAFPFSPSRRRFAAWGGGSLLALAGCGGGDGGGAEPPPPAPTPAPLAPVALEALSLVAGGLGGTGVLEGRGSLARLTTPGHVAVAPSGDVFFTTGGPADAEYALTTWLAKASPQGDVRILCPTSFRAHLAVGSGGTVYVLSGHFVSKLVEGDSPSLVLLAGRVGSPYRDGGFQDGPVDGQVALVKNPMWPVAGDDDQVWFVEADNHAVRRVSPDGTVVTMAGQPANTTMVDGQGAAAGFASPRGLVRMPDGNFLVLDGDRWRRVTPEGVVTTLPGTVPSGLGTLVAADDYGVFSTMGHSVVRVGLDGSVTVVAGSQTEAGYREGVGAQARFSLQRPDGQAAAPGLARASSGELVIADAGNHVLRRIEPATGQTSLWLGAVAPSAAVDGPGGVARFVAPVQAMADAAGNLYVLDGPALRKVAPSGETTTISQAFPRDGGMAVDAAGNFYGVRGRAIVKVTPAGAESVFAGQAAAAVGFADGPAAEARFAQPMGMTFDRQGNLLVGDAPQQQAPGDGTFNLNLTYGGTIRSISPAGQVSTIAGVPGRIRTTPKGPGLSPEEYVAPMRLGTDAAGNIYVLDAGHPRYFGGSIKRIGPQGGLAETLRDGDVGPGMAVLPSGTVYFAVGATVRRLVPAGTSPVVAGGTALGQVGVRTGALPASLNTVLDLIPMPDGSLAVLSEHSVLKIGPA
jgi:hypothetical protein